jgi:uncharacterized phiE125 gp8 family phage protein
MKQRGYLKLVTGPAVEPVTLTEALSHCRVDQGQEDSWFETAIASARIYCEQYTWRTYVDQVFDYTFHNFPLVPLEIPRAPLVEVQSVKYYGEQGTEYTMELSNFLLCYDTEPGVITLKNGIMWPSVTLREVNAFKIRFKAGHGATAATVPAPVKQAMLIHIAWQYENRAGETSKIPDAIGNLLRPDRMHVSC